MILKTFRDVHSASRQKTGRNTGVTLIELAFVIAIIAIVLVAVLGLYTVVKRTQELTEVTSDVAAIRQAVSTWASGGPLSGRDGLDDLTRWNQLAGFLPGNLGRQAAATDSTTLMNVNSMGCSYTINANPDAADRYKWSLQVSQLPGDAVDVLATRLRDGVVADTTDANGAAVSGLVAVKPGDTKKTGSLSLTYRH